MDFALIPLATLYGGPLFFGSEHIAAVLPAWVEWTKALPETANSSVVILRLPSLESIPEPLRGKTVIGVRFAFVGPPAEGERLLQPIRDLAPRLLDAAAELPTAKIGLIHSDPDTPMPHWGRGLLLTELDAGFAAALLAGVGPDQQVPIIAVEIRHLGAATRRDVPEGSAVGGRGASYTLSLIGMPDPSLFQQVLPQVAERILTPLAPWISAEHNINVAGDLSAPGSYQACWPAETFQRLAELRATYDPDGRFPS